MGLRWDDWTISWGQLKPLVMCGWSSMTDVPKWWEEQPVLVWMHILPVYVYGFCVCVSQTWQKPFSVKPEPPASPLTPICADSLGWMSWRDKYISRPPAVLISPFTLSISHHHRCCIRPKCAIWMASSGWSVPHDASLHLASYCFEGIKQSLCQEFVDQCRSVSVLRVTKS